MGPPVQSFIREVPYGGQTMSVLSGGNGNFIPYHGVPGYMVPQLGYHEYIQPNFPSINTGSGTQSYIRSNQVSDDFIKHF
jgi:hypothetical protein